MWSKECIILTILEIDEFLRYNGNVKVWEVNDVVECIYHGCSKLSDKTCNGQLLRVNYYETLFCSCQLKNYKNKPFKIR